MENEARRRTNDLLVISDCLSVNHGLQPRDAVFDWRMRAEQIDDTASAQWIHDEHVRGRRIRVQRHSL